MLSKISFNAVSLIKTIVAQEFFILLVVIKVNSASLKLVPDSRFHFWIKRDLKDFSIVSEKSSQARLNKHSLLFWCFSVWVGSQNLSKNLLALLERTKWNLLLWIIKYGNGVKTHWLWKLHYNGEWNCGCRSSEAGTEKAGADRHENVWQFRNQM